MEEMVVVPTAVVETTPANEEVANGKQDIMVLLATHQRVFYNGLLVTFQKEEGIKLCENFVGQSQVLAEAKRLKPNILMIDLGMDGLNVESVIFTLKQEGQLAITNVIILAESTIEDKFADFMKYGVKGIVLKDSQPEVIVKCCRKVHNGEIWLDSKTTATVFKRFSVGATVPTGKGRERSPLSTREREIVALVAQGYKNKEMAEKMFISEQTVKNHLHKIFDKLGVSDRLELALYAIHKGLCIDGDASLTVAPARRRTS